CAIGQRRDPRKGGFRESGRRCTFGAVPTSLSLQSGRLSFTVLPEVGGRVQKCTFAGRELLSDPDANPDNWGATYWTSPQADWGWPPVPEVDSAPYAATTSSGEIHLV